MSFSAPSLPLVCPATLTGILPNARVAPLAQWIEHLSSKQRVGGSNPSRGTCRLHLPSCATCRRSAPLGPQARTQSGRCYQSHGDHRKNGACRLDRGHPLLEEYPCAQDGERWIEGRQQRTQREQAMEGRVEIKDNPYSVEGAAHRQQPPGSAPRKRRDAADQA